MGGEVVVALGVMGVVAPSSHPLPGPLTLPAVTLVAVTVQLRRALVVLVVLREVVLLVVMVVVVGGGGGGGGRRGVAPAALVHLAVPAEAVGGGDGLGAAEASPAVVLTAPGRSRHRVLDAVAPVAP